ncbi:MAG: type II secretion system inner membrane protein GspF [Planctomycetota bacterium]|nr:type II secretion system inner membrane protein GspF [Planctomycetota bacterium]
MPIFEYKALKETGETTQGIIDADTPKDAREKLRARRIHVTKMAPLQEKERGASASRLPFLFGRRVDFGELTITTRQFATLLSSGIPMAEALGAMIQQVESRVMETTLRDIRERVTQGSGLADAMAHHQRVFSDLYINMVRAGEASGTLDEILLRLANHLQNQNRLRNKVKAALTIPMVYVVVATGVVLFLMSVVVPKIVTIFESEKTPIPLVTEILIAVSAFIQGYWWVLALFAVLLAVAYKVLKSSDRGRLIHDTYILKLPVFGKLLKKDAIARFAVTFSTLLRSGIPALECLRIVERIVNNRLMSKVLGEVHDKILEGADISTPLRRSGVFPPVVGYMIAVGEQTGRLEELLDKVAESYEEEIEIATSRITALIEPVIIVAMAVVVAFIVIAILLPLVRGFDF